MGFKVLDASAFYAGIPFHSQETHHTTPLVLDEVRHIKRGHDAIGTLIHTGRLLVLEPAASQVAAAKSAAVESGDIQNLSMGDLSVLALALELHESIITDDYSIANAAASLGIKTSYSMTYGIGRAGRWIYYCAGCRVRFTGIKDCPRCGNVLRRRLSGRRRLTGH